MAKWRDGSGQLRSGPVEVGLEVAASYRARRAALDEADLSNAEIARSGMYNASLKKADLSGSLLSSVALGAADLDSADLSGTRLPGTDLHDSNLAGVDLEGSDITADQVVSALPHPSTRLPEHLARDPRVRERIAEVEEHQLVPTPTTA
ncbi:pentapeptide repeat-containing protein [Streptomyces gardneri]|uniref:pentapeptide repeat-containing protein n=1 Tax=Streptomyces gardneri TaxID=66892 RepID=UPI0036A575F3